MRYLYPNYTIPLDIRPNWSRPCLFCPLIIWTRACIFAILIWKGKRFMGLVQNGVWKSTYLDAGKVKREVDDNDVMVIYKTGNNEYPVLPGRCLPIFPCTSSGHWKHSWFFSCSRKMILFSLTTKTCEVSRQSRVVLPTRHENINYKAEETIARWLSKTSSGGNSFTR